MIPRPQFFLVRPDTEVLCNDTGAIQREQGPMVPLIAVDELPDWIDIGLPRELTVEQTVGLYNLGMVSHNGDTYRVRIIEPNSQEEFVWKRTGDSSKATLVSSGVCAPGQRTMAHPEQQSQRVPYHPSAASTGRDPSSIHRPFAAEPCSHPAHPNIAAVSSNPNRLTRAEDEHSMRWADLVERSIARDTEAAHDPRRHSTLVAPPPSPQIAPHRHPTVHRDAMTPDHRASVPQSILAAPPQTTNVNTDAARPTTNVGPVSTANPVNPGVTPSSSTSSSTSAVAATTAPSSPTSSSATPQEYCRHWCQHGTCKWGTFCRHKHAIPTTLEGLLEVGLFEIPAWWISATGIGMSSSKTKQTAAVAVTASPTTGAGGNGGSGAGSGAPPPAPVPYTPMAHGHNNLHHHMLPAMMGAGAGLAGSGAGVGVASSAKTLSNRKLKAQQREFNQRLRLLSSMLIPPGYGGRPQGYPPLRHPADALLMHGMSMPAGQHQLQQQIQQQIQQQQQQQQQQQKLERERERKGEKTPLDRSRKNVKVTFNEDGTVSLVTAGGGGGAAAGQGQGQAASASTSGPAAGVSPTGASSSAADTGKPGAVGDSGGATDETDNKRRENDTKPLKGLASSMHAPKQQQQDQQGPVVVTIPPPGNSMSKKATCEDENEGGTGTGSESGVVQQLADVVPLLVKI